MELRVLGGVLVLACLAVSLSAQLAPGETARPDDSVEHQEEISDAGTVCFKRPGAEGAAVVLLPRVAALQRPQNTGLVRNVDAQVAVTANSPISTAGEDIHRHTLAPGEKRFFAAGVRNGISHHWVDIIWDASAGDLILSIYPPDGCLGPYTNIDDGLRNGRIFIGISSPEGLAPGDWYYEVSRTGGEMPVGFSFETYA